METAGILKIKDCVGRKDKKFQEVAMLYLDMTLLGKEKRFEELTELEIEYGIVYGVDSTKTIVYYYIPKITMLKYVSNIIAGYRNSNSIYFVHIKLNDKEIVIDITYLQEYELASEPSDKLAEMYLRKADIAIETEIDIRDTKFYVEEGIVNIYL